MIKKLFSFIKFILKTTFLGFCYDCLLLSKGFFFFLRLPFSLFNRIKKNKLTFKVENYLKDRQNDSISFLALVLIFMILVFLQVYLFNKNDVVYVPNINVTENENKNNKEDIQNINNEENVQSIGNDEVIISETDLYKKYGNMKAEDINFGDLKKVNSDVVAWLIVDGTNVNYPILQTTDNSYYLNHNIKRSVKISGWPFMDYRNSKNLDDNNTIFYGHNLLNKTGFGSLSNIFTDKWFNSSNHKIVVITENKRYVYEIFSCYYISPETYYLNNLFTNNLEYQNFLDTLRKRSKYNFNINLGVNDKIITLSTCTEDNKGRKVVHAKLVG